VIDETERARERESERARERERERERVVGLGAIMKRAKRDGMREDAKLSLTKASIDFPRDILFSGGAAAFLRALVLPTPPLVQL